MPSIHRFSIFSGLGESSHSDVQLRDVRQWFAGRDVKCRTTYEVAGSEKARITLEGSGLDLTLKADGLGQGVGNHFKNPVTGEEHNVQIVLADGFIWKKGDCGVGSFSVKAGGLDMNFKDSN